MAEQRVSATLGSVSDGLDGLWSNGIGGGLLPKFQAEVLIMHMHDL